MYPIFCQQSFEAGSGITTAGAPTVDIEHNFIAPFSHLKTGHNKMSNKADVLQNTFQHSKLRLINH